jgi:hypothetical protein
MTSSRFASRLASLFAVLALAVAPGCVKSKMDIVIEKDGSGKTSDSTVMDLSKVSELEEMVKGMMGGADPGAMGGEDPMAKAKEEMEGDFNPEKVKAKLAGKKGVELLTCTDVTDAEKQTRTAAKSIKFASLEDYFRSGIEKNVEAKLSESGGVWTLSRRQIREGMDEGEAGMGEEAAGMMEMMKGMFEPYMEGLDVSVTLTVPGTITETNGTKNEAGNSVTWKFNFDSMTAKDAIKSTVSFKGEGLTLKPFHLTIDENGKVTDGAAAPPAPAPAVTPK